MLDTLPPFEAVLRAEALLPLEALLRVAIRSCCPGLNTRS